MACAPSLSASWSWPSRSLAQGLVRYSLSGWASSRQHPISGSGLVPDPGAARPLDSALLPALSGPWTPSIPACTALRRYPSLARWIHVEEPKKGGTLGGPCEQLSHEAGRSAADEAQVRVWAGETPGPGRRRSDLESSTGSSTALLGADSVELGAAQRKQKDAPGSNCPSVADAEMRSQRLEARCWELLLENERLRADMQVTRADHDKVRELNLRLSRTVQESRHESAKKAREAAELSKEVHLAGLEHVRLHKELDMARAAADKAETSWQRAQDQRPSAPLMLTPTPALLGKTAHALPSAYFGDEGNPDVCVGGSPAVTTPPGLEEEACVGDTWSCSCSGAATPSPWGCAVHRVYSEELLLAHRELSLKVARGPPGLERPCSLAAAGDRASKVPQLLVMPREGPRQNQMLGARRKQAKRSFQQAAPQVVQHAEDATP